MLEKADQKRQPYMKQEKSVEKMKAIIQMLWDDWRNNK